MKIKDLLTTFWEALPFRSICHFFSDDAHSIVSSRGMQKLTKGEL